MDTLSITKWVEYSRAKDEMFVHTDIPEAPWFVVESEDKKRSRINVISHLLSSIEYERNGSAPTGDAGAAADRRLHPATPRGVHRGARSFIHPSLALTVFHHTDALGHNADGRPIVAASVLDGRTSVAGPHRGRRAGQSIGE